LVTFKGTSFYGRFRFSTERTGALWLPGPYEHSRLLGCELKARALDGARGLVGATGRSAPRPDRAAPVAGIDVSVAARRAA